MGTGNLSFQLEKTYHGAFLSQGCLGGVLAGFVFTVAVGFWDGSFRVFEILTIGAFLTIFTTALAIIKALIMWAPYKLAKIRVRAVMRVALTSLATGALALSLALLIDARNVNDVITWTIIMMLGGLPTGILVGSNIKPWNLFTFGTIDGIRQRSVPGALGTLPLRFLSLSVFGLWTVYFAGWLGSDKWYPAAILLFVPVAFYLLLSAYLTFRSPHKVVLLVLGLLMNLPVGVVARISYELLPHRTSETPLYVFAISISFLVAWLILLIARLSVRITNESLSILIKEAKVRAEEPEHHCLGSRFMEWQEHHA